MPTVPTNTKNAKMRDLASQTGPATKMKNRMKKVHSVNIREYNTACEREEGQFNMFQVLWLFALFCTMVSTSWVGECIDTHSECTNWSGEEGGLTWNSCDNYCSQKGFSRGDCRPSRSNCAQRSAPFQCFCLNVKGPKRDL